MNTAVLSARAARSRLSCSCRCTVRPALAVVYRARSGQPRQATPKMTALRAVTCRVIPAGAGHRPGGRVNDEVIGREAALDGGQEWPGLDHRLMPGPGDRRAGSRCGRPDRRTR